MHVGSSTDLLVVSEKVTENQNIENGDSSTRTDPILVPKIETDTGSENTGQTGKVSVQSQPPRNTDEAKTASGGVVGTSEAGSLEEDWVNLSLSPRHPLQSDNHPLQNSGD